MFVYYNVNPKGEKTGDCVVRAISLALNENYTDIERKLLNISIENRCDMLNKNCYGILLDEYNFPKYKVFGKKVYEIAEDFKDKKLIMRLKSHLCCVIEGIIYDLWDTSNEYVDIFWVIE